MLIRFVILLRVRHGSVYNTSHFSIRLYWILRNTTAMEKPLGTDWREVTFQQGNLVQAEGKFHCTFTYLYLIVSTCIFFYCLSAQYMLHNSRNAKFLRKNYVYTMFRRIYFCSYVYNSKSLMLYGCCKQWYKLRNEFRTSPNGSIVNRGDGRTDRRATFVKGVMFSIPYKNQLWAW
jgi:hypothetical protein